jgi:hypothetical protein
MAYHQEVIAYMCESALYCPEHCTPEEGEIEDGFVTPVTVFDVMCGDQKVSWLKDAGCCTVCGLVFSEHHSGIED